MASTDDLLFEPLNMPARPVISPTGSNGNGIIIVPDNYVRVDIQGTHPITLYEDAAESVIKDAVQNHPGADDVRKPSHPLPSGHLTLIDLASRYHMGYTRFWLARPQVMQPKRFEFEGRFGYFKFFRMPEATVPATTLFWFWIDSDQGQLAAIDLGLMCVHPSMKMYHAFTNENAADSYYRS